MQFAVRKVSMRRLTTSDGGKLASGHIHRSAQDNGMTVSLFKRAGVV